VYAGLSLPGDLPGRPYVVVNMVSTVDGKTALGESAAGIGSRADGRLMRQIRAAVDAIVWGAGTLRADVVDPRVVPPWVERRRSRGAAPQPLAVTASASLDLDPTNRFFVNGPSGTVVFTTRSAPPERRRALAPYATIVTQDGLTVDLAAALRQLAEQFGIKRLLSEGGPGLNQALLDAGLVDELFWTVAPKLGGGHGRTLIDGGAPARSIRARLELVSLLEHDGELYTRYRLQRDADGAYLAIR
jgi:2,5-diamino-6-(ribosylamino)-4(3H)-pyrimidinone 5'-phosphate reductase